MTVSELILVLQECPPGMRVLTLGPREELVIVVDAEIIPIKAIGLEPKYPDVYKRCEKGDNPDEMVVYID